jgi:mannose-1-phosphate guanylyltransferase
MKQGATQSLWAVVLAAGKGSRMTEVTHMLCGRPLPKQFVPLVSDRTMLQATLDRIAPLIPPERTVVVVAEGHEALAEAQLCEMPGVEIVSQPRDLGTGNGVLLPLSHVVAREPNARVAIFPSDHHFERPEPLRRALLAGLEAAEEAPSGVALLGAEADYPAADLGWIMPAGSGPGGVGLVGRFVEKPPEKIARLLLEAGGLWNTLMMVGEAAAFFRLCRTHLPQQTHAFTQYLARAHGADAATLRQRLYRSLPAADFSRGVLERAAGLAVVPLLDSGWFDCGTPERLVEWLHKTADRHGVLSRLGAIARPPADSHAVA